MQVPLRAPSHHADRGSSCIIPCSWSSAATVHSGTAWACWNLLLFTEDTHFTAVFQLLIKPVSTLCKMCKIFVHFLDQTFGRVDDAGAWLLPWAGALSQAAVHGFVWGGAWPLLHHFVKACGHHPGHHPAHSLRKMRHSCVIFKEIAILAKVHHWRHFSRTQRHVFRPLALPSGQDGPGLHQDPDG